MPSAPRTLHLIERTPQVVRLTGAEVEFLLSQHGTVLQILPTGQRHKYRLTPRGVAGVIAAPGCRLIITPKIPLRNLFLMLAPEDPVSAASDQVTPADGTEVLNFLAGQLALQMRAVERAGLYRAYEEKTEQGSHLQGRLDLPAQLRQGPARKDRLHSRHEELTIDLLCNQAPRAVAERLLAGTELQERVAGGLRQALAGWDGIQSRALSPEDFIGLAENPVREDYRLLLELCSLLWQGLAPSLQPGNRPSPSFLLDLERVFERYLTRGLLEAFRRPGWRALAQQRFPISWPVPGQPDLVIRPDVLVFREECPVLVIDAKWKRLKRGQPETSDLYQMLAYCTALGVPRANLVYPGKRDRVWTFSLRETAKEVSVHTLTVTASPAQCLRSLRRLGQSLRKCPPMPEGKQDCNKSAQS